MLTMPTTAANCRPLPARQHLAAPVIALIALASTGCPQAAERRAVDVGAWPIDQVSGSALAGFVVGDLDVQLGATATGTWRAGQASQTNEIEVPSFGRYLARGAGQFGASRTLGVAESGRWYRTLYLAPADALHCFALPMSDVIRWAVPTAEIATGSGSALFDCAWDASGVRLHASGSGLAALDWTHDLSGSQTHSTPMVDSEAAVINLLSGLRPAPHSLSVVARDAAGTQIGSWPASGSGRLLLLPALLDAVNDEIDFIQDSGADFEAPIPPGGRLAEVAARFRGDSQALYLRVKVNDPSIDAGDPLDVPALNTVDTIAILAQAAVPDAPLVRIAVGRNGTLSPGTSSGVSVTADGSDPWRNHVLIDLAALSGSPLGKNDIVRLCVHAYLDAATPPRRPTAVWPASCDVDSTQWVAVRLFTVTP